MMILPVLVVIIVVFILLLVFVFFTSNDRSVLLQKSKLFQYNETQRTYLVFKPAVIDKDTPIIVGLHGFNDTARRFAYYTGLHNAAKDAVILYPDALKPTEKGIKTGWNAKFCCGSGWVSKTDDVGFILALVAQAKAELGLDNAKVFVAGFSNGAFMSQRLATDEPDTFSAVAISSGSIGTPDTQLEPKQPIPILLMHGEKDTIVPFRGGVGSSDPDFTWLTFEVMRKTWERVNAGNAEVAVKIYPENGHRWNGMRIFNFWTKVPEASTRATEFFNKYR